MKKIFEHNCPQCVFLGTTYDNNERQMVDLYAHLGSDHISYLARFGNQDSEYFSLADFVLASLDGENTPLYSTLRKARDLFLSRKKTGE